MIKIFSTIAFLKISFYLTLNFICSSENYFTNSCASYKTFHHEKSAFIPHLFLNIVPEKDSCICLSDFNLSTKTKF